MYFMSISAACVKWAGLTLGNARVNFVHTNPKADIGFMQDLLESEQSSKIKLT